MKSIFIILCIFTLSCLAAPDNQMREWTINAQANNRTTFKGTFVKCDGPHVYIQTPQRGVLTLITVQLCAPDLSYVQGKLSKMPKTLIHVGVTTNDLLIDLSAADLDEGSLNIWENNGALKGRFYAINKPLRVVEKDGLKSVEFYYGPWNVPVTFNGMTTDVAVPESLENNGPFTLVALAYNHSPLTKKSEYETLLSWYSVMPSSDAKADKSLIENISKDGTAIGYGLAGRYAVSPRGGGAYKGPYGSFGIPNKGFPKFSRWQHITYVCSGGSKARFNIYVNGQEVLATNLTLSSEANVSKDMLFLLGCNWGSKRPQNFFTGNLAKLQLYQKALSPKAIQKLYANTEIPASMQIDYPDEPVVTADTLVMQSPKLDGYFTPEYDGLVSEPFPTTVKQNGDYGKIMEGFGQPVIGRDNLPDEAMIMCAYTMGKAFYKRPDIVDTLRAFRIAARLDHGGSPWLGYADFTTACYGQTRPFYADPGFYWGGNIMFHEMGHQFHMFGAEPTDKDFRQKLFNAYWQNKRDSNWIGDYGGLNMWEYIACSASSYLSDGFEDANQSQRETFRQTDPRMFYLLQDYWPGDLLVDLNVAKGLNLTSNGHLVSWKNIGGLEYWGKFGLTKYPWTTGKFIAQGQPTIATVDGVSAIDFDKKSKLVWNRQTRECLINNYAWSAEFWVYKDKMSFGNQSILKWGSGSDGANFRWDWSNVAGDFGLLSKLKWKHKPALKSWHHIVFTFKGGGIDNSKGTLALYVDGKLDNSKKFKFDISTGHKLIVGDNFDGALAHLRVYDYDLSQMQLMQHYADEAKYFQRPEIDGNILLVDLDASCLKRPEQKMVRPLYPKSLNKNWLRSWVNRGALAGKMFNDISKPSNSKPVLIETNGFSSIAFDGNSRMASSFVDQPLTIQQPISFECIVKPQNLDPNAVICQWGDFEVYGKHLSADQWQLLTVVFDTTNSAIYVNGKLVEKFVVAKNLKLFGRLNLAGEYSDKAQWQNMFTGEIDNIRIWNNLICQNGAKVHFATYQKSSQMKRKTFENKKPPYQALIVNLNTKDLKYGPLKEWPNLSEVGLDFQPGAFVVKDYPDIHAPCVMDWDDQRAMEFTGQKNLVSDFELALKSPFTISFWAYNSVLDQRETMLSLGAGDDAICFNFGWDSSAISKGLKSIVEYRGEKRDVAGKKTTAPLVTYWHHLVFSSDTEKISIFQNGLLVGQVSLSEVDLPASAKITLGAMLDQNGALINHFSGLLSKIKIYDKALDVFESDRLYASENNLIKESYASPANSKLLVDLCLAKKDDGLLTSIQNQGSLKGLLRSTELFGQAPIVETVAGKKAVTFDGHKSFLQSTIDTPELLTGIKPLTMEMLVYNPKVTKDETVFTLAPREAYSRVYFEGFSYQTLEFRYGSGSLKKPAVIFTGGGQGNLGWPDDNYPAAAKWHHIAFVYDGVSPGQAKIYVDGKLTTTKEYYTICIQDNLPMFLGTGWNTDYGTQDMFNGSLASIKVFNYVRSAQQIKSAADKLLQK